jgi:hypothetical protein
MGLDGKMILAIGENGVFKPYCLASDGIGIFPLLR